MKTRSVLGVDFGGVINDGASHPSGDDTAFLSGGFDEAMQTPAMAGVVPSLARLTRTFQGQVWVVSKCGPRIQERTEQWLRSHRFFEETDVPETHIRFCRKRPEKAVHCAELGITHFVDDRSDVLEYLEGIVEHRYLFGSRAAEVPRGAKRVKNWIEAEASIFATLA
jgi:hypothetical protein